jgi:amidase
MRPVGAPPRRRAIIGRPVREGTVATFITRLDTTGSGLRLAVKDLIDIAGVPTTAGCRAVADVAAPAGADAACLAGAREAERAGRLRIVGKTNLHELAFGVSGINPWFGTPVNPLDPARVPGGSSSGSAVAVATGEADVAYGTDTGGSVRIPSACCGTTGLKTTWGRVPLEGVFPLAPSLDTVGPMARDVGGVIRGMALLEPGFAADPLPPTTVGRLRVPCDPVIDAAVDAALAQAELEVHELDLPGWDEAQSAAVTILLAEAWASDRAVLERDPAGVGTDVAERLRMGSRVTDAEVAAARVVQGRWQAALAEAFGRVELIALPTLSAFPPPLERAAEMLKLRCTLPVNLAGVPALSLPVPSGGPLPASLQLVGPAYSEERLVAAGLRIEAAVGA